MAVVFFLVDCLFVGLFLLRSHDSHRFHAKYGLDVCGEGGEYESLVLDCPLFKRRLSIALWDIVADAEGSDMSVGNLRVRST